MTMQNGHIIFIGSAASSPDILQEKYGADCFIIASELPQWEIGQASAIETAADTIIGDTTTVVVIDVNFAANYLANHIQEILRVVYKRSWDTILIDDAQHKQFTQEMIALLKEAPPTLLENTASLDDISREINRFLEKSEGRPKERE